MALVCELGVNSSREAGRSRAVQGRVAEPTQAVSSFLLPLHCVSSQLPAGGEDPPKLMPRVRMEALKTGSSLNWERREARAAQQKQAGSSAP